MTDTVKDQLRENVERGAAWLDAQRPGWHWDIDVAQLDLSRGDRCVLGQVGEALARESGIDVRWIWTSGYDAILWGGVDLPSCIRKLHAAVGTDRGWAEQNGFCCTSSMYPALDDLWIEAIKRRVDA